MSTSYRRLAVGRVAPARPPVKHLMRRAYGAAMLPSDADFGLTADHIIDDPREPRLMPIGILDHRGMMLIRVSMPIKVQMGFHIPNRSQEPDEVEAIIPEDMLAVSDSGLGVGHVEPHEVEDEDEVTIEQVILAALEKFGGDAAKAKTFLMEQGLDVEFTVDDAV